MTDTKAEKLPAKAEELLGYVLRHIASELRVSECPEPLAESLRIFTRAVMAIDRDMHEHPTPVVHPSDHGGATRHFRNDTTLSRSVDINAEKNDSRASDYGRATLPTEPPGVGVSYEDPPVTGRTSRGFPRAG